MGSPWRKSRPSNAKAAGPDGLCRQEARVMNAVLECLREFSALPREHPDELRDFVDGIHRLQGVLAMRVVRRSYPGGWRTLRKRTSVAPRACS
jgi:hypothetical protein